MKEICVEVDDAVKAEAEAVCKEMGLPLSEVLVLYLTKIAEEKRLPFELSAEEQQYFFSDEIE